MSKNEHEQYKYQLSQVAAALQADLHNPELLALQSELQDIIALTAPAKLPERSHSPPPAPAPALFRPGDIVMARWLTGDGSLYPARITSLSGSLTNPVYTVLFLNYNNTETLRSEHVKQISESRKRALEIENSLPSPAIPPPPKPDENTAPAPPPIKKQKVKPKSELDVGKKAWQKFATKGVKSRAVGKVQKIGEKSIFKSPEDGLGRVGVTGSGKGMIKEISTRGKHVFEKKTDDD
ncbi:Splicing factor spf30 [Neolecta irregularis DAH-3]|uniref:Splicing factor spf30 n=1 Tax=Neolecta irregularis (strain DAH-3) TaxID=1198029 RepID=A0A1U7LSI0_NEOID|nr:Splicing factor spf30 [Neolecta irregularis DAH-3]|eukprot:OLL25604.1 Splicing factor spf30 [Neolecta irregularis DAH-3]